MGSSTDHTSGRRIGRTLAAVVAAAALGACSGGGGDDARSSAPGGGAAAAGDAATVNGAVEPAAARPAADERAGAARSVPALGEQLAVTARATVRAAAVKVAVDRVSASVTAHGGRVAAADVEYGESGDDPAGSRATLVLAVPPDQLTAVRDGLDDAGEVVSFDQQAEDVSKQLADLDSRIANQRASIARIRQLYRNATDIEAIVRIEAELTERETALEQVLASQAALEDRVVMATLTVDVVAAPETPAADDPGVLDALAGGWSAFAGGLFVVVLGLTAAMPFLIAVLALCALGLWVAGVLRRRRPSPVDERVAVMDQVDAAIRPE